MVVNNIKMLLSIILLTIMTAVTSYEPLCSSCKWFLPNKNGNVDYGFCKMNKNSIPNRNSNIVMYDYAKHCRNNDNLCGKSGYLFEENKLNSLVNFDNTNSKKKYNVNEGYYNINEKQYNKEIQQMLKRCKKHNIQNVYNN